MAPRPRLLIFASGTDTDGGSGFENLVAASRDGRLTADIVGVVSNHEHGGVSKRAKRLGIPFFFFSGPYETNEYRALVEHTQADFVSLSGWLKLVKGLNPKTTFNIHPGPLPAFGGAGLYGEKVHQAVLRAFKEGHLTHSAVSMHFVTERFDEGPVFFSHPVPIEKTDTEETLQRRVQEAEHHFQPLITDEVISGRISWDGRDPKSLRGMHIA
jgi:folate-dependent phosphoribosylglycinamide formyltransferase PurN